MRILIGGGGIQHFFFDRGRGYELGCLGLQKLTSTNVLGRFYLLKGNYLLIKNA